jgi:hypothetical protein
LPPPTYGPSLTEAPAGPVCVSPSLQCTQSTFVAGLEVDHPHYNTPGQVWSCTVGAVAKYGSQVGFLTSSHCTYSAMGTLDGTTHGQGVGASQNWTKVIDPAFTVSSSALWGRTCPTYYKCRLADVQFAAWANTPLDGLGYIATTVYENTTAPFMTEIATLKGRRILEGREPPMVVLNVGDDVRKTGRTTGTTVGTLSATCVDIPIGPSPEIPPYYLICQDVVKYFGGNTNVKLADLGDSGAPVFTTWSDGSTIL